MQRWTPTFVGVLLGDPVMLVGEVLGATEGICSVRRYTREINMIFITLCQVNLKTHLLMINAPL